MAQLSHSAENLQTLLYIAEDYSLRERYDIQATKSAVLIYGNKLKKHQQVKWQIREKDIPEETAAKHLGITRDISNRAPVDERLCRARNMFYALMGVGLHGENGLNPVASLNILQVYIVPAVLHGLETLVMSDTEIHKLEIFYRKVLRQIQGLPDRVGGPAIYILAGVLPIEGLLHLRILALLGNICRDTESLEHQIGKRQILMRGITDSSWFSYGKRILTKYSLPSIHDLFDVRPAKNLWKTEATNAVWQYWNAEMAYSIKSLSSLRYLNHDQYEDRKPHQVWTAVNTTLHDLKRATIKAKLITGTYRLQANRARFNQHLVNATCLMCKAEAEDRYHFLTQCTKTADLRESYTAALRIILTEMGEDLQLLKDDRTRLQIILDCTKVFGGRDKDYLSRIEANSRYLCWALHLRREKSQMETT